MPHVQTGDIETYYEEEGQGPPLVLLHASTLDRTSWKQHTAILRDRFRVIALDLRGHGRTACDRPYTVDDLAGDLESFRSALGLERFFLCGLSMGGMVALAYASRHPERVAGLAVAGAPTPAFLSGSERFQRAVMPKMMTGPVRLVGYDRFKRTLIWVQAKVHGKEAVGGLQAKDLPSMPTRAFVNAVNCFAHFHETKLDLDRLRMPTLVLYGEKEPGFIQRHARLLSERLPHVQVAVIPEAGHASSLDDPERFAEAIADRFSGIPQ